MTRLTTRGAHYAVLTAAHLLLTLPNLGAHTLWDMDEGVNAEAAREMLESGNWVTPTFNYELRTAKPAGLYWFVALSYQAVGVCEFAARLPSVLFGLGSVLLTYELARRLFSPSTGLLSALVLASSAEFCLISHAVTPDPPLLFFTLLTLTLYRFGSEGDRRWWFVPVGAACGLAVLVKGPVGLALPGLIVLSHLAWTRRLGALWDRRVLYGAVVFLMVAGPWYGMVTLETKGKWLQVFFLQENLLRFSAPADGHRGGPYYHVLLLLLLFGPWSVYLPAAAWYAVRDARRPDAGGTDARDTYRFLVAWALAVLVVFSVAATKLPNYVLPLYPAVAILTGRFLDRWRQELLAVPGWVVSTAVGATGVIGLGMGVGGAVYACRPASSPLAQNGFNPSATIAMAIGVGLVAPVVAVVLLRLIRTGRRGAALAGFAAEAVAFLALLASVPTVDLNEAKAPKYLAEEVGLRQTDRDVRLASWRWMRHSLVFYARREVTRLDEVPEVDEFLSLPRPGYLLVPENEWDELAPKLSAPTRVVARRYDFYSRRDVLVVAGAGTSPP